MLKASTTPQGKNKNIRRRISGSGYNIILRVYNLNSWSL